MNFVHAHHGKLVVQARRWDRYLKEGHLQHAKRGRPLRLRIPGKVGLKDKVRTKLKIKFRLKHKLNPKDRRKVNPVQELEGVPDRVTVLVPREHNRAAPSLASSRCGRLEVGLVAFLHHRVDQLVVKSIDFGAGVLVQAREVQTVQKNIGCGAGKTVFQVQVQVGQIIKKNIGCGVAKVDHLLVDNIPTLLVHLAEATDLWITRNTSFGVAGGEVVSGV
mmetsp:Transcript_39306/g.47603  ORF Transcript_39306/g.47603 Transcript_39306/m.47603 type:complete len:219 (-) Transcript_39306:1562-2218(-)